MQLTPDQIRRVEAIAREIGTVAGYVIERAIAIYEDCVAARRWAIERGELRPWHSREPIAEVAK